MPEIGAPAPEFSGETQDGAISSADFEGKKVALYFYPRDATPGCTRQACNLRDHFDSLKEADVHIVGVSDDPPAKHIRFAKKHNLPEPIIDFIRTHHGTTLTRYFYNSYKQENPEEADENKFRYPGPVPHSKEAAILMMADAVEAASRSLKKHNEETINSLVEGIVDSQANEQQFVNAAITFKDLTEAKKIFKKKLMNIYHVRIEYPK